MLYTLSKALCDQDELHFILSQLDAENALVLWQDGVLQAVKNPQIFADRPNLFVMKSDLLARGLSLDARFKQISMSELVALTETFSPQIAL